MIIGDIFNVISLMSPYLVPTYLVMGSMINQDVKAFLYLACLTLNVLITTYIGQTISDPEDQDPNLKTICQYGPLTQIITRSFTTVQIGVIDY